MQLGGKIIASVLTTLLVLGLAACEDPVVGSVAKARLTAGGASGPVLNELVKECRRREEGYRERYNDLKRQSRKWTDGKVLPNPSLQRSPQDACRCYVDGLLTQMSDFDVNLIWRASLHLGSEDGKAANAKPIDLVAFIRQLQERDSVPEPQVQLTRPQLDDLARGTKDKISALLARCKST